MTEAAVLAVVGPTAVGKSAVAEEIACRLHAPVISADAMQVYRGMDIGTAKTPVAERRAPLLMVDVADPADAYSAALYQRDCRKVIDDRIHAGQPVILCGGTGLYVRAALDEMTFPAGELADDRRSRYQELAEQLGADGIHRMLEERDPESASLIHPNNVRRCIRALEMADEGISYARQRSGFKSPRARYPYGLFALMMGRERLYRRIDERVDRMVAQGLVDEVRALMDRGAADALTARQAIGYKEIIDSLAGNMTLDDAIALIKQRSRRYAKRQLSWWRHDPRTVWFDMDVLDVCGAADAIMEGMGL